MTGDRRVLRRAALAVACALLATGCGSTVQGRSRVELGAATNGSNPSAPGDVGLGAQAPATPGAPQSLPGSAVTQPVLPGAGTDDPGSVAGPVASNGVLQPLSIGFFNNNNSAINSQYGYTVAQGQDIDKALVQAVNANHGLAGHKLVAHFVEYSASSTDYASESAAACQTFTRDTRVSVVLSPTISTAYGFADCLQQKGVLLESSAWTDAAGYASHPLLFSATGSTFERGYTASLDQLHASGNLTAKNHLGVFLESCPEDARAWSRGIQPEIRRLGVPLELTTLSCTGGVEDAGAAAAAMQGAILKWRGAGVDRVMFVTTYESTLLVLFSAQAESQGFRPGYVLTSLSGAPSVASGGSFPQGQKAGLRGAGTLPGYDVDSPPPPSPAEKRCLALAHAGGVEMTTAFDRGTLYQHCASLFLLEAGLSAAGPGATNAQIRAALSGLGTSLLLPALVEGRTQLDAHRSDAPAYAREFGWQAACSCIRYLAPPARMTG